MVVADSPGPALRGKTALITGGSKGLGFAMAEAFARAGARLALIARSRDVLEAAAQRLTSEGHDVRAWCGDVTDLLFMQHAVSAAEQTLGPVDLLVNNAGAIGPIAPVADVAPEEWWRSVEVNLRGTALGMQLVLAGMCVRGRGRIINVVSGAGITSFTYFSAYVAAKTALVRLTECTAAEVRPYGVCVFAMEPGTVATDMSRWSLESEAGRRWIPWFARMFTEGLDSSPAQVAQRALALASGRADVLSGRYIPLSADLDELVSSAARIEGEQLYSLRMARLSTAPVSAALAKLRAEGGAASTSVLQLQQALPCSPSQAFALWMDPTSAAAWFTPATPYEWLSPVRADARVGGLLSFHLRTEGTDYTIAAVYRTIEDNVLLVFDWSWETGSARLGSHQGSVVTVRFVPRQALTDVIICHEGMPSVDARDMFIRGWRRCLNAMIELVRRP
ncbi:MAG TPA: SDR family NAD(P)-dependent oxidoreductase [Gemmatimonadales bacterium]|nr:SDR family NAD(P)-dependent oxidoreductase [Gemmatimonadales bacterium]